MDQKFISRVLFSSKFLEFDATVEETHENHRFV
jgi:hypothetical protein